MQALRYYRELIWVAFSHSVEIAHGVIFLSVIAVGIVAYFIPAAHMNLEGPEIAAIVLGTIVAFRLVMAPYWIHAEQEKRIPRSRPEWQRANTGLIAARNYIATQSEWCLTVLEDYPIQAKQLLERAILNGEIEIWGKRNVTDAVFEKIQVIYWKTHKVITIDKKNVLDTEHREFLKQDGTEEEKYFDLRVDSDDIIRLWPRAKRSELRRHWRMLDRQRLAQRI